MKKGAVKVHPPEQLLLNEVQLLLAEKRTHFAMLRTGIAIFALPLTITGFLLATARYHNLFTNIWVAYGLIGGLLAISSIGVGIFYTTSNKLHRIDGFIDVIKNENKRLAEILV